MQAVRASFERAQGLVDRVPAGKGNWKFRLMAAGQAFLAEPRQAPPNTRRRPSCRRARPKSTELTAEQQVPDKPTAPSPAGRRASGRPGPKKMLTDLISRGYFSGPRTIGEVQAHIDQQLGYQFTTNELAPGFTRLLREGALKRNKREDGQYQYTNA